LAVALLIINDKHVFSLTSVSVVRIVLTGCIFIIYLCIFVAA